MRIRVQMRNSVQNEEILTLGPIVLEPEKHLVLLEGKEVPLTQKEFAL